MKVGVGLAVSANDLNPFQIEQKGTQNKPLRFECGHPTKNSKKIALRGSSDESTKPRPRVGGKC